MNRINWTELKPQIQQVGRLSLPAILTQITTIAMQYIDSAMVGALGANASAAIGLVSSTTWLLSGTIYAVSAGFSVQVAHQDRGKSRQEGKGCCAAWHRVRACCVGCFVPDRASDQSSAAGVARRCAEDPAECHALFYDVCHHASVFPAQLADVVLPAVQR